MEIIQFIQSFSSPFLDEFFQVVTMLGEEYFYILMLALVFWCIDKRYGYKLSFAFLLSGVVNGVAKSIVNAPRPIGTDGIRSLRVETATGTSFPSGHTQSITSFMVSVMKKLNRAWAYIVGCILILLVGISRMYLGVHWPLDVLGGIVFGTAAVLLADAAFEFMQRKNIKWLHLLLLIPVLAVVVVWHDSADLVKTAGTFSAFLIGFSIESRFIHFDPKASFLRQVVKYVLGIAVALALKEGLKLLFPEGAAFNYLRYLIVGLWVTVGAPVVFMALKLNMTVPSQKDQSLDM
jgi:membrane-associated phospholipid phosphatase